MENLASWVLAARTETPLRCLACGVEWVIGPRPCRDKHIGFIRRAPRPPQL